MFAWNHKALVSIRPAHCVPLKVRFFFFLFFFLVNEIIRWIRQIGLLQKALQGGCYEPKRKHHQKSWQPINAKQKLWAKTGIYYDTTNTNTPSPALEPDSAKKQTWNSSKKSCSLTHRSGFYKRSSSKSRLSMA